MRGLLAGTPTRLRTRTLVRRHRHPAAAASTSRLRPLARPLRAALASAERRPPAPSSWRRCAVLPTDRPPTSLGLPAAARSPPPTPPSAAPLTARCTERRRGAIPPPAAAAITSLEFDVDPNALGRQCLHPPRFAVGGSTTAEPSSAALGMERTTARWNRFLACRGMPLPLIRGLLWPTPTWRPLQGVAMRHLPMPTAGTPMLRRLVLTPTFASCPRMSLQHRGLPVAASRVSSGRHLPPGTRPRGSLPPVRASPPRQRGVALLPLAVRLTRRAPPR